MNNRKICFILCCNNDYYLSECKLYLSELLLPEDYDVEIVEVRGAKSMTAGYNEGMSQTDAKYKIYLHQDVFITNKNFLCDMLAVFQSDSNIGLMGMVGTPYMVKNGTMWYGIRYGEFYKLEEYREKAIAPLFLPLKTGYMEVEAVDGLLIATQYDLPWREDLFKKWDFYDASQSFEFIRAGYKVVVPGQAKAWYIHDCGILELQNYDEERRVFLQNYKDFMYSREQETWEDYVEAVRERVQSGFHGEEAARTALIALLDGISEV